MYPVEMALARKKIDREEMNLTVLGAFPGILDLLANSPFSSP
jgi:hypothetical protein